VRVSRANRKKICESQEKKKKRKKKRFFLLEVRPICIWKERILQFTTNQILQSPGHNWNMLSVDVLHSLQSLLQHILALAEDVPLQEEISLPLGGACKADDGGDPLHTAPRRG